MTRLSCPLAIAALLPLAACVFASSSSRPETVVTAPNFDRSFDAALGAAADVGIQVSASDRAGGRITGSNAGAPVTIDVLRQADGSLRIVFNGPSSPDASPSLKDRWTSAYNRRMNR